MTPTRPDLDALDSTLWPDLTASVEANGCGYSAAIDAESAEAYDRARTALPVLVAEVRRLEQRQQELLQTIRNLSATVPYPEEERAASVLIAEVGTLRSALAESGAEGERLRGLLATPHEPEPTHRVLRSGAKRVTFTLCGEDVDIPANRALSLGAALIRAAIRTEGGLP
jgi:hypothetical protein